MTSIPGQPATADVFAAEAEAAQVLLARAHRKTGRVPPELVVRHVLAVTRGGDWPVQRDALEALIRRFGFGRADGLQIVARPPRGRLLGLYATRRRGSSSRPYRTPLRAVEPLSGAAIARISCGARDAGGAVLGHGAAPPGGRSAASACSRDDRPRSALAESH